MHCSAVCMPSDARKDGRRGVAWHFPLLYMEESVSACAHVRVLEAGV